jgi:hypothetical protein
VKSTDTEPAGHLPAIGGFMVELADGAWTAFFCSLGLALGALRSGPMTASDLFTMAALLAISAAAVGVVGWCLR